MMKKKSVAALFTAACLAAGSLAGCSGASSTASSEAADNTEASDAAQSADNTASDALPIWYPASLSVPCRRPTG